MSLQKKTKKRNINRSRLKLQTGLTNIWSFILVALNLSSSQSIIWYHWMMNFFLNYSRKWSYGMKIGKGKENIIHVLNPPGWGTAPKGQEETLKGNCRYIILANRIKFNKPSVTIIFLLSYLFQVCMRRMITTISSGPWAFTTGDFRAVWECTEKCSPRVRGGHTAHSSHVWDSPAPGSQESIVSLPTRLPPPILIINKYLKWKHPVRNKSSGWF